MAITIDYGNTNVIFVPQADLTLVSGTLYEFDTDAFHDTLRDLEDDETGQVFTTTHNYVPSDTIAGVTDFPKVIILSPYSVEFEDGTYSVRLAGTNNNIFDVGAGILVQNTVQVIPGNSFGNTITAVGSGLSAAQAVWLEEIAARLDVHDSLRNTYQDDNSQISNSTFTLDKTDNLDGTFTIGKS